MWWFLKLFSLKQSDQNEMFNECIEIDFPSWPIRRLSRDGVLNHFLPGSISGLGMMWVISFGSISLETSSRASSLQQMVTDCAYKVVRLAAIGAHRTVFVLFLSLPSCEYRCDHSAAVKFQLCNLTCWPFSLAWNKAEKLTLHFCSFTRPSY